MEGVGIAGCGRILLRSLIAGMMVPTAISLFSADFFLGLGQVYGVRVATSSVSDLVYQKPCPWGVHVQNFFCDTTVIYGSAMTRSK